MNAPVVAMVSVSNTVCEPGPANVMVKGPCGDGGLTPKVSHWYVAISAPLVVIVAVKVNVAGHVPV